MGVVGVAGADVIAGLEEDALFEVVVFEALEVVVGVVVLETCRGA